MENGKFIWKDGKMVSWDSKEAMVHVSNHSLNYGSAVFEGIRFYETLGNKSGNSAVFRLEDHVNRLFHSASVMGNDIGYYEKREISDAIVKTVRANKFKEGYIRPIVFFGDGIGIDFGNSNGKVVIMAFPWERYKEEREVRVYVPSVRRLGWRSTVVGAKISGTYFNSLLAHKEARENGYEECLQLGNKAEVEEGPGENIFFVKDNYLLTPKVHDESEFLPGIMRDTILELGRESGFGIEEKVIRPAQMEEMDEAFFCGTAVEIIPIKEINYLNRLIRYDHFDVTNKIKKIYMDIVRGKNEKHLDWLTFV